MKHSVDLESVYKRGVPNYDWDGKTLTFIRNGPQRKDLEEEAGPPFEAFAGAGNKLKKKKSRT